MIPTIAVLCGVLAIWLAVALWLAATLRLSLHQAVLYAPLKIAYRIDDRQIRAARKAESPIVYVIWHQSHLDPALMLSLLPDDTLHILDQRSAASIWLEPWRALARTIPFNTHHVFVSRRLVRHLRGNGRLAVYMPDDVEPDAKAFRLFRAVARIAAKADAGIVPIFVNGSRYSHLSLSPASAAPRRLLPKLSVKALPATTIAGLREQAGRPPTTASNALFDYFVTARFTAADLSRGLFLAIRDAADRFGCDRSILEDPASGALTYRQLFAASRIAGKRLAAETERDEAVGLLLPHSTELMTSLLALQSSGRVGAILDETGEASHIASAVVTANLKAVLTSRTLVEKAALGDVVAAIEQAGAKMLWLEDVGRPISRLDKLAAHWLWRRSLRRSGPDTPAAMLFSPTAEGVPKATVLSSRNIVANAMQLESRIAISPADRVFSALPASRAFGLTGGLILPLLAGARTFLDRSPPAEDGLSSPWAELQPTILVGPDSLFAAHGSRTDDGDSGHLRTVLSGPEPVSDETRRIWNERFGIEIMTGFGKDEAASLIALNTRTHGRSRSAGRLLPAIEIRLESVEGPSNGSLWISGPNIALGAMHADAPGILQPPLGGWHDSGTIISSDREGFIVVHGRVGRLARIGDEMASLDDIEAVVREVWPDGSHLVVSVPDRNMGERVVLVTTSTSAQRNALKQQARKKDPTQLNLPTEIVTVSEIPVLAGGGPDYGRARQIAMESLGLAKAA